MHEERRDYPAVSEGSQPTSVMSFSKRADNYFKVSTHPIYLDLYLQLRVRCILALYFDGYLVARRDARALVERA